MGGKTISTSQPKLGNISLQTSTYGLGLPIRYGTNRGSGNLIWYGNFQAIPHTTTSKAGKGLGQVTQKDTSYTYTAAVMMALGEGPIAGVGTVWKGKDVSTLAALGLTLLPGTSGQGVWSFLSGYNVSGNWQYEVDYGYAAQNPAFTDQALGYDTTAILAASAYDLGSDGTIPNHGFEIKGMLIIGSGNPDCYAKDFVSDFLTNTDHGVPGFKSSYLGDLTTFHQYTTASGLFISPQIEDRQAATDHLSNVLDALNTEPLWSDGVLKMIPLGDKTVTGNGQTYTPNLTPIYDLTDDSYGVDVQGPVRLVRKTPVDAYNQVQVEFCNRNNQYNVEIVTVGDQNAVELYGAKPAPVVQMHFITDPAMAKVAAQLYLQRTLYQRNQYECPVTGAYALLEPGDLVTLTDTGMTMSRVLVRILDVEEVDEGFKLTCEDMLVGVAAAAQYPHDSGLRYIQDLNTPPQACAAPFIFEMPADADSTGLAIGVAVGAASGDPLYGGANIWASLDGVAYQLIGTIFGSSRYGTLTGSLASGGATLAVHLTSGGQLVSVSSTEATNGQTMLTIDTEYLDFTTATLTGASAYNLTTLHRGFYDTTPAAHSSGAKFARVDDAICTLGNMDLGLIGKTIHIKCTAFNTYGGAEQDLSTATDYTYAISGYMQALGVKAELAKIGEDGWVTPAEKQIVIKDWTDNVNEKSGIDAKATALGIDKTAYDAAYTALAAYLAGLTPGWNDTTQSTPVTRATWNSEWTTFEDARRALLLAIQGLPGVSSAAVPIYHRGASSPTLPSASTTYTFATGVLSGLNNGWTQAVPTDDGTPLWVSAASASSTGTTDTIAAAEWASPIIQTQSGLNTATVFLFQRATSSPAVPSGTLTYTFATGVISGATLGSWTQTVPSGTSPVYVITATALGTGTTDTIATGEWATPVIQAQNGTNGTNGTAGTSPIVVTQNPSSALIPTYSSGAAHSGMLPFVIGNVVYKAGVSQTITAISVTATDGCTADVVSGSTTSVEITAISAAQGSVTVSITAASQTVSVVIPFSTVQDGSAGATSTTIVTTTPQMTWTTYTEHGQQIAINASSTGKIQVNLTGAVKAASGGFFQFMSKIRYSGDGGGTWTDVSGSESTSTTSEFFSEPPKQSGANVNGAGPYTIAGLTAGAPFLIDFVDKKLTGSDSTSATCNLSLFAGQVA